MSERCLGDGLWFFAYSFASVFVLLYQCRFATAFYWFWPKTVPKMIQNRPQSCMHIKLVRCLELVMVFCKILCQNVTHQHNKICQSIPVLQWKCICITFYMMLRLAFSFIKHMLDFGLNFPSKTCLWGMVKLSLFDVMFLYHFWIKFISILTTLDTQNRSKMVGHPWSDGVQSLTNCFFPKDC